MFIRNSLFLCCAILLCAGCRTPIEKHHVTRDTSADFSAYRTFALVPAVTKPELDRETAGKVIVASERGARDALLSAGYTETNRENADMVVYLHGKVLAPTPVASMGYQPTPSTFGITERQISATSPSHIFVEAYDNQTKRQVWMDWVECTCTHVVPSRLEGEIHHVLEGFPLRTAAVSSGSGDLQPTGR